MTTTTDELPLRSSSSAPTTWPHGVRRFELRRRRAAPYLPTFTAGSHLSIEVPGASGKYSLCNDPT
jgi:ferredoxin-NADP reductase